MKKYFHMVLALAMIASVTVTTVQPVNAGHRERAVLGIIAGTVALGLLAHKHRHHRYHHHRVCHRGKLRCKRKWRCWINRRGYERCAKRRVCWRPRHCY